MRFLTVLLLLGLAACGRANEAAYPPQIEMNFRNACQAQNPPAGLCACVWARIATDVPASDFMALERLPINERQVHPLTEQINGYALACHVQLQNAPAVEPAPSP